MNIAVLGCGYVADFYMATRGSYPQLTIVGAFDREPQRTQAFSKHYAVKGYGSFEELLRDPAIEMVWNLTNPRDHYETTHACLAAGKHVYSEKPLAMESTQAIKLAELAHEKGLYLASAPCSMLSATAQTLWQALRKGAIGKVRLVYASFDDGMVHRMNPQGWRSTTGAPWPIQDEFEVGCTYEHAGYLLTWLAAFFGPARKVTAFSSCLIPDKGSPVSVKTPDFSLGCIEYDDVVARVTCSIVAPIDKSITIVGDEGVLYTKYVRNDASPVYWRKTPPNKYLTAVARRVDNQRSKLESLLRLPWSLHTLGFDRKYPFAQKPSFKTISSGKPVDFLRGPAELADAIQKRRPCRLSADLGVHLCELIETLQYPERFGGGTRQLATSFAPIEPLPTKSA
jgi:predicted dehydrogenase